MPEQLPPDSDAVEKWRNMPQNKPSREALPPLTGGSRWLTALMIVFIVMLLLGWLSQFGR
jgi:hypothetical protein